MYVLQTMSEVDLPLLMHGEVVDSTVDVFDREAVFIETVLKPIVERCPSLRIVMEHITTKDAVEFIKSRYNEGRTNIAATITAHHLLYNRNDIFKGGICPHMYCLPILKRETHRLALVEAATSGIPLFFIGVSLSVTVHCDSLTICDHKMELYDTFHSYDSLYSDPCSLLYSTCLL